MFPIFNKKNLSKEKNAVFEADFVVVLLPGGKGTHIELGIALGQRKRIFLYSSDRAIDTQMHSNGLLGGEIMPEDVLVNVVKENELMDVLTLQCP